MFLLLISFFLQLSSAQENQVSLMIKAPSADEQEFMVHSQLQGSEKISQWQQQCSHTDSLHQSLKEAQFHFLNGSLNKSKDHFKQITENKWLCDWALEERQAIHYAYMRLAQMSASDSQQIQWLTDAINFDSDLEPDAVLIPPPTVLLFKKVLAQIEKKQMILPESIKKYSIILRNGKILQKNSSFIEALPLRARFTFVSEAFKNEVLIATPAEIEKSNFNPKPWVTGTCTNYKLADDPQLTLKPIKIYFDKKCIVEINQRTPETQNFAEKIISRHTNEFANETNFPQQKTWIERNYLWLGATVLASAVLIIKMNSPHEEKAPYPTATFTPDSKLTAPP